MFSNPASSPSHSGKSPWMNIYSRKDRACTCTLMLCLLIKYLSHPRINTNWFVQMRKKSTQNQHLSAGSTAVGSITYPT